MIKGGNKTQKPPSIFMLLFLAAFFVSIASLGLSAFALLALQGLLDGHQLLWFLTNSFVMIFITAFLSLFDSFRKSYFREKKSETESNYLGLSILSIFRKWRGNSLIYSQYTLGLGILSYIVSGLLLTGNISVGTVSTAFAFLVLCVFYSWLTDFRIDKGFFMTNEKEAKDLTSFILSKSRDIDFNDPGGDRKDIMSSEEIHGILQEAGQIADRNVGEAI